jgi:hypothetical protein
MDILVVSACSGDKRYDDVLYRMFTVTSNSRLQVLSHPAQD